MVRFQGHPLLRLLPKAISLLLSIVFRFIIKSLFLKVLQNISPSAFYLDNQVSFMTFKSTKYAKIMTDPKKYAPFDNIRFPQLRFHCKYYKEKIAYRSECPEIFRKNLL